MSFRDMDSALTIITARIRIRHWEYYGTSSNDVIILGSKHKTRESIRREGLIRGTIYFFLNCENTILK